MSSEQGTTSDADTGKFTGGTQTGSSDPDIAKKIAKKVNKELGLTTTISNPNEAATVGNITGTIAHNLSGKDKYFYGEEASQLTNEELVKAGLAKQGNPYYDHKGNITGYSYHLTSKGKEVKYGKSGGAMGSGDPSGVMSSIAISKPMWQSQQKLKQMIGLGMMAIGTPMAGSVIYQSGKGSYNKYIDSFYNQQSSTSMAQNTYTTGNISQGQGNASDSVGTSTLDKSFSDTLVQDTSTKDKQIKLAMANQEIGEDKRTFLKANKRTITAGMSTV